MLRDHATDARLPHPLRESPRKRIGVFSLEHHLASRRVEHVARVHKSRYPKRLMLPWMPSALSYGRSLQLHLPYFNFPAAFAEWATLVQDRTGLHELVTESSQVKCLIPISQRAAKAVRAKTLRVLVVCS